MLIPSRRFWTIIIINLIIYGFSALPARAEGEYLSDYEIIYQIDQIGATRVTNKVKLINQTERFYATNYSIKLSTNDISQIQAHDRLGALKMNVSKDGDSTEITLEFNDQVVGKGKVLEWELSYLNQDYARRVGQIWEIDVPALADSLNINDVVVKLEVPVSFGDPAYIFPQPQAVQGLNGVNLYIFTKEDYLNHGLSLAFGQYQLFGYSLDYHLKNPNLYPVQTQIALPPDTTYQTVVIIKLEPEPLNNIVDEDGNWIADYQLVAGQSLDIRATGYIQIFSKPKTNQVPILTPQLKSNYLRQEKYWDVNHPRIQELAKELDTPYKVYEYVSRNLRYNQSRLEGNLYRMGASSILNTPDAAVCMEFTDLFIAIARAAGIPAREINGYAYTSDPKRRPLSLARLSGDVLHAWPEYYDQDRGWIPVDPTWGATTKGRDYFHALDFNHVTFAIHGLNSEWPPPAGSYKFDGSHQNDVHFEFAENDFSTIKEPVVQFELPSKVISAVPVKGKLVIKNKGNILYPQASLSLSSPFFTVTPRQEIEVNPIPPKGHLEIPIDINSPRITQSQTARLEANYDGQVFSHELFIQPFFLVNLPILIIGGGVLIVLGSYFISKRARHLFL